MVCGGMESICTQLTELGALTPPSTYYDHITGSPAAASRAMANSREHISRVHAANYGVYGARKVWLTPEP